MNSVSHLDTSRIKMELKNLITSVLIGMVYLKGMKFYLALICILFA